MSKQTAGQIQELGGHIEEAAGPQLRAKVMQGAEKAAAAADMNKVSLWVKEAIDRLDSLVDQPTRGRIMNACGRNCCRHNYRMVETIRARRLKFDSEAAFLQAEVKRVNKSQRLELQGNTLVQYYTPRLHGSGRRCFCSLMGHLPEGVNASPTYCECSRGFAEEYWQGILGRPLRVEIKETALGGAPECKFLIYL